MLTKLKVVFNNLVINKFWIFQKIQTLEIVAGKSTHIKLDNSDTHLYQIITLLLWLGNAGYIFYKSLVLNF